MKFKIIFSAIFSIINALSFVQTISGKVLDAKTGAPLQGATVNFLGKTVKTDVMGLYVIPCGKPGTLSVSYVGYNMIRRSVLDCTSDLSVSLTASENDLDKVEITAVSNINKAILYQPQSITKLGEVEIKEVQDYILMTSLTLTCRVSLLKDARLTAANLLI